MISKILDFKMPLAYLVTLIFISGIFYQKSEATTNAINSMTELFVRKDVQIERDMRLNEKLDMLLKEVHELKAELKAVRRQL